MESTDERFLFTSESVGEGHPDKLCDQISDAILDAHLAQDPYAKVACECAAKSDLVVIFGEITSTAIVDIDGVVRETIKNIGYENAQTGIDYKTCDIIQKIEQQSPEIAAGVHVQRNDEDIGAGDQGTMFGYATDETMECMPLTVVLAHGLSRKLAALRHDGTLSWARPDCKTQVTVEYVQHRDGSVEPIRVHTIVISVQHSKDVSTDQMSTDLHDKVITSVIPERYLDKQTLFHLNPSGSFIVGGPKGDAGLTGRKIIVDTYGGWGAHGGGAFSGKDPTKVDRSAGYAARWIAKSVVTAGLCRRVLIQLSYAIGVAEPLAVSVNSFGTGRKTNTELLAIINKNFDLRPGAIISQLSLRSPIYKQTACYGHFGPKGYKWEKPKHLIV